MTQDTKRLQLLDGGLDSTPVFPIVRSVRPQKESLDLRQLKPCADELTTTIKATESRLSALLEDRGRIGRDLHDCVLQSLYAIGLNIETSHRMRRNQPVDAKESDDQTIPQINQLIQEIRGMIRELESGTIQEFELTSELFALRETYERTGRVRMKLDLHHGAIDILTKEEEREILSIVREAVSNCIRHAHATEIVVSIRMSRRRIQVSILDDGIGFSTAHLRGYGLANMETRAQRLGGTLRVQSKVGKGTQVLVEFSLEPLLVSV
ncbi:MAG TPA: ATP-binding protein [Nitrospira sp.]